MDSSTKNDILFGNVDSNAEGDGFFIGLTLAICSSIFIGSSFIIKKVSLIRLTRNGNLRAASGGFGYLKDWMWWLGLVAMGVGELFNFVAYAFAPASLVTPLGALSVLVSNVLAAKFFKESLNTLGKWGCFLCIVGSTVIIIFAPKDPDLEDLDELIEKLQGTIFLNYILIVVAIILIVALFLGPKYGSRYVTIYLSVCSAIGSVAVMACKALGLTAKEIISGTSEQRSKAIWLGLILLAVVVFGIFIQMVYLNKALDIFSTSIVTPVYYVMFTTCVLLVSAILFNEFHKMTFMDVSGELLGFVITVIAIFMITRNKENKQPIKNGSYPREYSSLQR